MSAKLFITALLATVTCAVNAQSFQDMLNAVPSNATRIEGANFTLEPAAWQRKNNTFKFYVGAATDRRNCEFLYEDFLLTVPKAADILNIAAADADDDEKVTRTKIDGKDAVIIREDDEVKTIVALAPDRILSTDIEKGKIEHGGKNLYTPFAPLLKNAFYFIITREKISMTKEGTHLIIMEPAEKNCLVTISVEFPGKAAADRAFKKAMRPENDEPAENAIRAKIKRITIPGLEGERISCQVTLTSPSEIDPLMECMEDLCDDLGDDSMLDD